jgi:purine nucleoside phosphorylase
VEVLWCPVHNWQKGLSGTASSLQLFFTLHQFGVQYILMDASVGGIKPLKPWDLVIPYDFVALADNLVELSLNVEGLPAFIRMAEPLCPDLREIFSEALEESGRGLTGEVYKHGVYISKPLGRFETPAEVQLIHSWSQAAFGQVPIILGQSLGLDAEGARRIGAHAAELCLVANFAEGLSPNKVWWVEEGRSRFYEKSPRVVGPIMLQALKLLVQEPSQSCHCRTYWAEACSSSLL